MSDLVLFLLRHGESTANVEKIFASQKHDVPLSENGVRQVEVQAEKLKSVRFSAMYSSTMLRARQTSEIVSRFCRLEPEFAGALLEVDVGVLEGKTERDGRHRAMYERVVSSWDRGLSDVPFPHGESLRDVERRLAEFLDRVEQMHRGNVLLVGHCLLFGVLIRRYCGGLGPSFENYHMGRGRLSIVKRVPDGYQLVKFNLPPEAEEVPGGGYWGHTAGKEPNR